MRRSALARRVPLKRRPRRAAFDRAAAQSWRDTARLSCCAVCGSRHEVDGHHVLKQQSIVPAARRAGLDVERVRWDARNLLPLCRFHHASHHAASQRVPRSVLEWACPEIYAFAEPLGLAHLIDREYPKGIV